MADTPSIYHKSFSSKFDESKRCEFERDRDHNDSTSHRNVEREDQIDQFIQPASPSKSFTIKKIKLMNSDPDVLGLLQENNKQIGNLIQQSEGILGNNRLRFLNIRISQNKIRDKNQEFKPVENDITDLRLDE